MCEGRRKWVLERWTRILIGGFSRAPGVGPTFRTETVISDATPLSHFCSFDFCGKLGFSPVRTGCKLPCSRRAAQVSSRTSSRKVGVKDQELAPTSKMYIVTNNTHSTGVCTGLWGPLFQRLSSRSFWKNESSE